MFQWRYAIRFITVTSFCKSGRVHALIWNNFWCRLVVESSNNLVEKALSRIVDSPISASHYPYAIRHASVAFYVELYVWTRRSSSGNDVLWTLLNLIRDVRSCANTRRGEAIMYARWPWHATWMLSSGRSEDAIRCCLDRKWIWSQRCRNTVGKCKSSFCKQRKRNGSFRTLCNRQ